VFRKEQTLFTKPLSQIEYSDVEAFCGTFGEGVRVEYKREMIKEIPKIISAFANTLGGIIVIGAETDKVQNKVISIDGVDKKGGIKESIVSSSLNGIYPAAIPDVEVIEIPGKKDKVLVVVKVYESAQAPHAIQNSTRVYVRTGEISQPYDLAEIDRIEYLLKRREKPAELREQLIKNACDRNSRFLGSVVLRPEVPKFSIAITPVFPYQPLISLDELYPLCNSIPYGSRNYLHLKDPQRISEGICKFHGNVADFSYREINHYGLIYTCDAINKVKPKWQTVGEKQDERLYVNFAHFVIILGRALKSAELFYNKCAYLGNIEIRLIVENIANEYLMYNEGNFSQFDGFKAVDNRAFSSETIVAENINSKLTDAITSLIRRVLWVFNCQTQNPQRRVEEILRANGMIEASS